MNHSYYRFFLSTIFGCCLTHTAAYGDITIDGVLDEPEWNDAVVSVSYTHLTLPTSDLV